MRVASRAPAANSMLAALPRKQYQRLLTGLESVALTFGEVLHEPGERIQHVYFPSDSLVSLLTLVEGHLALEVGMVGREGMVGVRRVGVTTAARALQKRKLIAYSRGKISILDHRRLERAACSCYKLVKDMNTRAKT